MPALLVAASGAFAAEPARPPVARLVTGELTRVDLSRRSLSVKTDARDAGRTEGRDAGELDAAIGPETRLVSRGRALRLEDLRPGDRVVLLVGEEGGRRLARVVKVVGRAAVPAPSPSASPAAPGTSG
jgi:hypothetical protein